MCICVSVYVSTCLHVSLTHRLFRVSCSFDVFLSFCVSVCQSCMSRRSFGFDICQPVILYAGLSVSLSLLLFQYFFSFSLSQSICLVSRRLFGSGVCLSISLSACHSVSLSLWYLGNLVVLCTNVALAATRSLQADSASRSQDSEHSA